MKGQKGVILIITSWIIAILTLFAIGVGFRTGLDIRLTGYTLDKLKALYIAKAGIKKAIIEKWKEYAEGKSLAIDALSEPWANNEDLFKDIKLGDGKFTVSYKSPDEDRSGKKRVFYGLEDESGRINLNSDNAATLMGSFLAASDMDVEEANAIAAAIEDWRDEDTTPKTVGNSTGAEDTYYQSLPVPYSTSGADFAATEELLLVKGITKEVFLKDIAPYVTVFGEGKLNINTASVMVLNAAFGPAFPQLAPKVASFRQGVDGKSGTGDDRWFTVGTAIIDRGTQGMVEVKNLNDENWYGNIYGITPVEYKRLRDLTVTGGTFTTTSDIYRASVSSFVDKIRKEVTAVVKFNKPEKIREGGFSDDIPPPDIEWLFWHEER